MNQRISSSQHFPIVRIPPCKDFFQFISMIYNIRSQKKCYRSDKKKTKLVDTNLSSQKMSKFVERFFLKYKTKYDKVKTIKIDLYNLS